MKKFVFLMMLMIIFAFNVVLASTSIEQTLNYIGTTIVIDSKTITPKDVNGNTVSPFIIDGTNYLPVRAVCEALGKDVSWNGEKYEVHINDSKESIEISNESGESEKEIYTEKKQLFYNDIKIFINENEIVPKDANGNIVEPFIIDGTTYLPVRAVAEALNKNVSWKEETKTVIITTKNEIANITNVSAEIIDGILCAKIDSDKPIEGYNCFTIKDGSNRLVLDLENTNFAMNIDPIETKKGSIQKIRFGKQENNVSRIVLDMSKIDEYIITQSEDKMTTYLALSASFAISENESERDLDGALVASNDNKLFLSGDSESGDEQVDNEIDDDSENQDVKEYKECAVISGIKYSTSSKTLKVSIDGDYEYTTFSLVDPNRVVIDFENTVLEYTGPKEITLSDENISSIRIAQNDNSSVRIVFDVAYVSEASITENKTNVQIGIKTNSNMNLEYEAFENYATIVLKNTELKNFTLSTSGTKCYISYSSKKFKSGKGEMDIDDDFVDNIVIKASKITIYAKEKFQFKMVQQGDNVVIKISEKKSSGNKVILIDAGHGGKDPGACNGTLYEKVYNLKIAQKLCDMLEDTDGIEVRMSRDSDEYLSRDDRLDFVVNENDDADLLVSIHNNSLENKNYQGTMVLYYNKPGEKDDYGITSKEFAQLVKENLVDVLDTVDRGIVSRDDLWILTQNNLDEVPEWNTTNIPSILCEVVFISNDEEAKKLTKSSFQQDVAQAIYDGIMEALEVME